MSIVDSIERVRRPGDLGYRQVGAVYLGTQEECVFARDPNESPSRSPVDIGGDCLFGRRPDLEKAIKAGLMAVSDMRTLRVVKDPLSHKLKPELDQGWDGNSGTLVISERRVYQLFPSSYMTRDGISRGHFLLQEISAESVRFVENILHFVNLDNLLRLELWETPVTSYQVGRRKLLVPQKWGGSVVIEGSNPGGLMTEALDVINKEINKKQIPVWRKNKI